MSGEYEKAAPEMREYEREGNIRYYDKNFIILIVVVVIAMGFSACGAESGAADAAAPVRFLSIEGDVEELLFFNTGEPVKNDNARPGAADFEGEPLTEFVSRAGISGEPKALWLISSGDGFTVKLAWEGAGKAYIYFSAAAGWRVAAPEHPLSANASDIDRIILVSENSEMGLRVKERDGSISVLPFGELLTSPLLAAYHLDGKAEAGSGLYSEVYTRQFSFALSDVYENGGAGGFVVVTENGGKYLTDGQGRFVIHRQKFDYIETTGDVYENVLEIELR